MVTKSYCNHATEVFLDIPICIWKWHFAHIIFRKGFKKHSVCRSVKRYEIPGLHISQSEALFGVRLFCLPAESSKSISFGIRLSGSFSGRS